MSGAALAPAAPDLASYARIVVAFSGGKDSLACLLAVLDAGVEPGRIELHHHDVDGASEAGLMDWPCTLSYCRAVADAFGIPLIVSWRDGGFEREMLRQGERTARVSWRNADGTMGHAGGTRGKLGTRRRFPQVTANLRQRWCSPALKIDVGAAVIRGSARFQGSRTLVVSGERAEESASRARYAAFEPDRASAKRRHVDRWRPVHGWSAAQVWAIIERYRVAPHPAYVLGWGRVSCLACIFGNADQWASVRQLAPDRFARIAEYERAFASTIRRDGRTVVQSADKGKAFAWTPEAAHAALASTFTGPAILPPGAWTLPAGAKGSTCGPT